MPILEVAILLFVSGIRNITPKLGVAILPLPGSRNIAPNLEIAKMRLVHQDCKLQYYAKTGSHSVR